MSKQGTFDFDGDGNGKPKKKKEPEHGKARRSDPDTSHKAAGEVDATRLEGIVLAQIRNSPNGLIGSEIAELTGLCINTTSPRTRPLVNKGLIQDSKERRPGPTGKSQIVWKAK